MVTKSIGMTELKITVSADIKLPVSFVDYPINQCCNADQDIFSKRLKKLYNQKNCNENCNKYYK